MGLSINVPAQVGVDYNVKGAIREIHEGWLILCLPGFGKKLTTLDSMLNNPVISEGARSRLLHEKMLTIERREFIHKWYPEVFDKAYTFSRCAYIYTHEVPGFQSGLLAARSMLGEPLHGIHRDNYFFATLDGILGDAFVFTTPDHHVLSYPFPNQISMRGLLVPGTFSDPMPIWIEELKEEKKDVFRAYWHAKRVNKRLTAFYLKMNTNLTGE